MILLVQFIALNICNVVLQTFRSIATINCGKTVAALVNAVTYGFYTVVVVYTLCELPLFTKALVVALCNLVGVFVVKLIEEKSRKDKLWKIDATVSSEYVWALHDRLLGEKIPFYFTTLSSGDYTVFSIFSKTQADSLIIKEMLLDYEAKYFVSETKIL